MDEILGYECMTKGCGAISQKLLQVCPLCGKRDWRAIVVREKMPPIKENPTPEDILGDWGYIKEEYLPMEVELRITKENVPRKKFEIRMSESSKQGDETGFVSRIRILDKENDKYIEKVYYNDTGTIIRDCDEKLTEHFGHGSDKENK